MELIEFPNSKLIDTIYEHHEIYKNDKERLYKYLSSAVKVGNRHEVNINYQQHLFNGIPLGRYYNLDGNKLSAMYQWNKIRSSLYGETEFDIDIVNCHQTILYQLAQKLIPGFRGPTLKNYIDNRDAIIDDIYIDPEFIDNYNVQNQDNKTKKDFVKTLFTLIIYGGNIKTWKQTFKIQDTDYDLRDYYRSFYNEVKLITNQIIMNDDPEIMNMVSNIKEQFTIDKKKPPHCGKILSIILQDIEQRIVMRAIKIFQLRGKFPVTCYIYDGFQIYCPDKSDENVQEINSIINEIHEDLRENLQYDVTFIIKPFRNPLSPLVVDENYRKLLSVQPFLSNANDMTFGNVIKEFIGDRLIGSADESLYWFNGRVWRSCCLDEIFQRIDKEIYAFMKHFIEDRCRNTKTVKALLHRIGSWTDFKKAFARCKIHYVKSNIIFDNKPHLLNAPNGTYDLEENVLREHRAGDYLQAMINYEIDPNKINVESLDCTINIMKSWFEYETLSPSETREIVTYFLHTISCCMSGNNPIQKAIVLLGKLSRNGKSTFINLLQHVFGNYVGFMKMEYLTQYSKNSESAAPALIDLKHTRFTIVNEAETDDLVRINQAQFKMWIGKDVHKVRDLYKKNIEFTPQGTLMFVCNDDLKFKGDTTSVINKLTYFNFRNWFGDHTQPGWNLDQPQCKSADPDFKEKLFEKSSDFLHALLHLRIIKGNNYAKKEAPADIVDFQNECLEEVNDIGAWADRYLVHDRSAFNSVGVDSFVCSQFPKIHNKPRVITLEFLYKKYSEHEDSPKSQRVFNKQICNIFINQFDARQVTKLFGGKKKKFLRNIRYIQYDDDEDDDRDSDADNDRDNDNDCFNNMLADL